MVAIRLLKAAAGLMLVATFAACSPRNSESESKQISGQPIAGLVPVPRQTVAGASSFRVSGNTPLVYSDEAGRKAAEYFRELAHRSPGVSFADASSTSKGSGAIRFRRVGVKAEEGAYSLTVSAEGVAIEAATDSGLFYGAVTLWQLLTASSEGNQNINVPAVQISDAPRFRWRGLMLDSARHYQSPEFIKRFIDTMSLHKLNVLHWHLTDDQAWRLEIKRYPRLTDVGAWRVPAGDAAAADIDPATGKPKLYGGFYSQEVVREIVAYAAARHITVVPEIEMPGHASAAIAAYPELATAKPLEQVPADWGVYPHVYNVQDSTFAFLENVLAEVIELFPSEYIHVGGDEAVKDQWRESPATQARMKALGIADEAALQSYFIQRMEKFLNSKGRRLIGWDEILEGGLAPNATVMSWRGIDGAVAAAKMGHDTVLSPAPTLYFDNRQFANDSSPGRGRLISMEEVYRFDPAPAQIPAEQRGHILGVQANLWSEHIRTEPRMEYMAWPRAAAVAEVAWSPAAHIKWEHFQERMTTHEKRLDHLGVRYARPPADRSNEAVKLSHDLTLCSENIALSLEDDAPRDGERATFFVDIMNPCWIARGIDLSKSVQLQVSVGQVPFNFQIGRDIEKVTIAKSAQPELHVRTQGCEGNVVARVPIKAEGHALTKLDPIVIPATPSKADVCFTFAQPRLEPLWVLHSVAFTPAAHE